MKKVLLTLVLIATLCSGSRAQEKEENILRIDSELVTFEVAAYDKTGRAIGGLKPEDFSVFEDGQQQEVVHFTTAEAPIDIVIVIDTSGSIYNYKDVIRQAVRQFAAEAFYMNEGKPANKHHRIALIQCAAGVKLMNDFVTSQTAVERGIWLAFMEGDTNGSAIYDALDLAIKHLKKSTRRKAILMLTDGIDTLSQRTYEEVLDKLERERIGCYFVSVDTEKFSESYAIRTYDDPWRMEFSPNQMNKYNKVFRPRDKNARTFIDQWLMTKQERLQLHQGLYKIARDEMSTIAARTGGRVMKGGEYVSMGKQFIEVIEELRTLYSIGYYPNSEQAKQAKAGSWRTIKVELKIPDSTLHYRTGYRAN